MTAAGEYDETDSIYVEKGNFEQVPHALWLGGVKDDGAPDWTPAVSPRAVVMYLALSKRGSRENRGVPKRATLARDLGTKSVRTVDAALDELIEKGWLLITPRLRQDAPGQTSNHYRLLWTPITSPDDDRLVQHLEQVTAFDRQMSEMQAKNGKQGERSVRRTVWRPPAQISAPSPSAQDSAPTPRNILRPGGAENDAPPVQESAHQEKDLSGTRPLDMETPSGLRPSDDAAQLPIEDIPDIPPAADSVLTEQEAETGRDANGKPLRGKKLDALAQQVAAAWWEWIDAQGHSKPAQSFVACRGIIRAALGNGIAPKQVKNGLVKITVEGRAVTGASLQIAMQEQPNPGMRRGGDGDVATWGDRSAPSEQDVDHAAAIRARAQQPPQTGTAG